MAAKDGVSVVRGANGGGRTAKEHVEPVFVRVPLALGVALPLAALGRREERACASTVERGAVGAVWGRGGVGWEGPHRPS